MSALRPEDRSGPTWGRIADHLRQRIATLRAQNDKPIEQREADLLRGRIAELKDLLALGEEQVEIIE